MLAAHITANGGTVRAIQADIADAAQAREAVEQTVRGWGHLDIVVNNAGIARSAPMIRSELSDWDNTVAVNPMGSLYCAHAALPYLLRAASDGHRQVADLVNVSSLSGRTIRKGSAVYCATKHAMNAYSEALRQELAEHSVRVTVLEPAAVETELFPPDVVERRRDSRGHPPLQANDVADAIAFAVTRPPHVAVSELLIRPTRQER